MRDENEVIEKVLAGDVEAFRQIVERYQAPIVRMVDSLLGGVESAQDIAQEVFLTAYTKLRSFDSARSRFSTWLFTIARNKSVNALKKKRPITAERIADQAAAEHDPSDTLSHAEMCEWMDHELAALPAKQRRAFVLAEFEQLPYDQIAQIEGVGLGTVKSRISRARAKLRSALRDAVGGNYEA